MFILEGCSGFSKNYSKTYRDIADVRKGAGSYSLLVQQLDHEPVKPWSVQQRIAHAWEKAWMQPLPTGVSGNPEHICSENHGESQ